MNRDIFLGVGGSASSNIFGRYLFNRQNWASQPTVKSSRTAIIIMSGVDSGGSIGMQNDLLNLHQCELNRLLHGRSNFPFQSYGDLKHFLIGSLRYHQPEVDWKSYWDFRSFSLEEHIQKYTELSQLLNLDFALSASFVDYLAAFIKYFEEHKSELSTNRIKPICLGNVLGAFLHSRAGDINNLSQYLQKLGILPKWVEFIFVSTHRTHLQGRDRANQSVQGEHLFDEWQQAIMPHSHKIHNDLLEVCLVNERLDLILGSLDSTDQLIIPPGSDSNWLGIVNQPQIRQKIQNHQILWLTNLFKFASETSLWETLTHLNSLQIYPQVFLPNVDFVESLFKKENLNSLKNYVLGEQKIPQIIYLMNYSDLINNQISDLMKAGVSEEDRVMLQKLLAEVETNSQLPLSFEQNSKMFYEVEVKLLEASYMHDRDFAENWVMRSFQSVSSL